MTLICKHCDNEIIEVSSGIFVHNSYVSFVKCGYGAEPKD
jgi:hypothetical protein